MSTTLITSRDPKGLQAVRMFEAVYDKAKLDDQRAQRLNENPELASRLRLVIDELSEPNTNWPPVNEWFDLEVDNTIDPLKVVTMARESLGGWQFLGPKFEGRKTYRVKLITLGSIANLEMAREDAKSKGYRLLEGQGRDPFRRKIKYHHRCIVFGGNEWKRGGGLGCYVACLNTQGDNCWQPTFKRSDGGRYQGDEFDDKCLWAVVEQGA